MEKAARERSKSSFAGRLVTNLVLPLLYPKRPGAENMAAKIAIDRRAGPALPAKRLRRRMSFSDRQTDGVRLFGLSPRRSKSPFTILYLHGGAYVFNLMSLQWKIAENLVDSTGAKVVTPLYPLAPEQSVVEGLHAVEQVYRQLAAEVGAANIIVVGDSAGGGLALSLLHRLRDSSAGLPGGLVLLFPWLDATMDGPSQRAIEETDPILDIDGLRKAARMWAGGADLSDPRVSPLLADQSRLPPIVTIAGTRDILFPDALRLKGANRESQLHVFPGMFHGFICAPIPEAREAYEKIAQFFREREKSLTFSTLGAEPWPVKDRLAGYRWPVQTPRARVLLQHGYSEHTGRYVGQYEMLVGRLLALDIEVCGFDLAGHGFSPGPRGVTDIAAMVETHICIRDHLVQDGVPLFLFGHSLGGLVTAASVARSSQRVAGVILSSASLPEHGMTLRRVTNLLGRLTPSLGVAPLGDPGALSRRPERVKAYLEDPLVFRRRVPAKLAASALEASARMWPSLSGWKAPTLVMHGLSDTSTSAKSATRLFHEIGAIDKTLRLVPEGRHELLNDVGSEALARELLGWIEGRLRPTAGGCL